jgi:hypothetical protein
MDQNVHNNSPDTVMCDKTIKQAYLTDAATPNNHILHSTLTEKLHKPTDLKEEVIRIWRLTTAYTTISTIHNGYYFSLHISLKLLNLHPASYILMQKAAILNACHIGRQFVAEE